MKNEEVIRIAQGLITDFKCESETMVEFCNAVIKALKQQPCDDAISKQDVLDKIRTEIENIDLLAEYTRGDIKRMALAIIDKYKVKGEDKE